MNPKLIVTNEIDELCHELLNRYKQAVIDSGHVATGNLAKTATVKARFAGSLFVVTFRLEDYWKYVENGRRPGAKQPPLEPIEKWIEVRHIVPTAKTANGKPPTTKQFAFAIAKSIAKDGIPPAKLLQQTLDDSKDLIQAIENELTKQLEQQIIKEIKL